MPMLRPDLISLSARQLLPVLTASLLVGPGVLAVQLSVAVHTPVDAVGAAALELVGAALEWTCRKRSGRGTRKAGENKS